MRWLLPKLKLLSFLTGKRKSSLVHVSLSFSRVTIASLSYRYWPLTFDKRRVSLQMRENEFWRRRGDCLSRFCSTRRWEGSRTDTVILAHIQCYCVPCCKHTQLIRDPMWCQTDITLSIIVTRAKKERQKHLKAIKQMTRSFHSSIPFFAYSFSFSRFSRQDPECFWVKLVLAHEWIRNWDFACADRPER